MPRWYCTFEGKRDPLESRSSVEVWLCKGEWITQQLKGSVEGQIMALVQTSEVYCCNCEVFFLA